MFNVNDPSVGLRRNARSARELKTETHFDPECEYKYLKNWIETATGKKVFVMVRVCKCSSVYENRKEFLHRHRIFLYETGKETGVDVHNYDNSTTEDCEWKQIEKPDGSFEFARICYCSRG
ncbi:hypothetical protein CHS0354_035026 [Potamilus streckersoni]|uniref:Uncharacterized protein n=1 Tax=Potamilus streckersoni TaxID=2493646 RepID=A0AAE0SE36_9BIVA|nr:hypothetical protein CHS0354_035026 [Potamilus streckersoni]